MTDELTDLIVRGDAASAVMPPGPERQDLNKMLFGLAYGQIYSPVEMAVLKQTIDKWTRKEQLTVSQHPLLGRVTDLSQEVSWLLDENHTLSEMNKGYQKECHELQDANTRLEDANTQLGSDLRKAGETIGELHKTEAKLLADVNELTVKLNAAEMALRMSPYEEIKLLQDQLADARRQIKELEPTAPTDYWVYTFDDLRVSRSNRNEARELFLQRLEKMFSTQQVGLFRVFRSAVALWDMDYDGGRYSPYVNHIINGLQRSRFGRERSTLGEGAEGG